MSFKGRIEGGKVVVDRPLPLPDGTPVRIEPVQAVLAPHAVRERREWRGAYRGMGPVPSYEEIRDLRRETWPRP